MVQARLCKLKYYLVSCCASCSKPKTWKPSDRQQTTTTHKPKWEDIKTEKEIYSVVVKLTEKKIIDAPFPPPTPFKSLWILREEIKKIKRVAPLRKKKNNNLFDFFSISLYMWMITAVIVVRSSIMVDLCEQKCFKSFFRVWRAVN